MFGYFAGAASGGGNKASSSQHELSAQDQETQGASGAFGMCCYQDSSTLFCPLPTVPSGYLNVFSCTPHVAERRCVRNHSAIVTTDHDCTIACQVPHTVQQVVRPTFVVDTQLALTAAMSSKGIAGSEMNGRLVSPRFHQTADGP